MAKLYADAPRSGQRKYGGARMPVDGDSCHASHGNIAVCGVISASALLVIVAHLALLPDARWTADEYDLLAVRPDWLGNYLSRILGWSPRPFSESLVGLYAVLVERAGRPLVTTPLAICWGGLMAGPFLASRLTQERPFWSSVARGLTITALLLLAAKPGEVFYWPGGSLAYMPTLAAMSFVVAFATGIGGWSMFGQSTIIQRLIVLVVLVVCACSSEIGACFVLFLALFSLWQPWNRLWRITVILAAPTAVSLTILLTFAAYRGQGSDVMQTGSPTFHQFLPSLIHAVQSFAREFVGGLPPRLDTDAMDVVEVGPYAICGGLTIRVLLLYGMAPLPTPGNKKRMTPADLAPAAAFLITGLASLYSAYHNFGTVCCERHETMRQALFILATTSTAAAIPWPQQSKFHGFALLAVMLVLVAARLPGLLIDYRLMPIIIAAKSETWRSGRAGGSSMTFTVGPQTVVAGGGVVSTRGSVPP